MAISEIDSSMDPLRLVTKIFAKQFSLQNFRVFFFRGIHAEASSCALPSAAEYTLETSSKADFDELAASVYKTSFGPGWRLAQDVHLNHCLVAYRGDVGKIHWTGGRRSLNSHSSEV